MDGYRLDALITAPIVRSALPAGTGTALISLPGSRLRRLEERRRPGGTAGAAAPRTGSGRVPGRRVRER
ncbi:hypothetical protein [Streptomyces sp. YIM 98790]|uniref:hypothetical protein n=1 Tax=Streptomyces sp. YIM 98790 TaxID=2689077 RepID=UPI00140B8AFA|nr:hypothetical protein [Streptomyces sp. YIM 98790]